MKVIDLEQNGADLGFEIGDDIRRINGKLIRDALDYRFHAADEFLEVEFHRNGEIYIYEIEKDPDESLGLQFPELKIRGCANDCIFCFVDQNPEGMRTSLYFRDGDYRFSFLHGHYVTLTNVSKKNLERIVEQRMSPLYVSVHTTDEPLRQKLLGIQRDTGLFRRLDYLTKHGIDIHTQIVLCPDLNDGVHLEKTIQDLFPYYPKVKSIAVVPLGLTKHREGLPKMKSVDKAYAKKTVKELLERGAKFKKEIGENFVYIADEFFIKADYPVPNTDYYDGFHQIEDGVGMVRELIATFEEEQERFPKQLNHSLDLTLITGELSEPYIKDIIAKRLNEIEKLNVRTIAVKNNFYGDSITISGLLTGGDMYYQLKDQELGDRVILPPNCLNDDNLFLDDWTVNQLQEKLNVELIQYQHNWDTILSMN